MAKLGVRQRGRKLGAVNKQSHEHAISSSNTLVFFIFEMKENLCLLQGTNSYMLIGNRALYSQYL